MINYVPIELDSNLEQHTTPKFRYYTDEDQNKYYSVTTVLSILSEEGIQAWRARVGEEEANRISAQASKRGTKVHDMIEEYIIDSSKDGFNGIEPSDFIAIQNFQEIKPVLDQSLTNVYATEARLYSKHLGLAGTVDCVGEWDGKLSIIDWKTSKKFKKKEWIKNYFMQATAYAIMWEERTGTPITQLVVCIAGDEGPQVFIEHRDNWDKELIETINEYKRRKLFGR